MTGALPPLKVLYEDNHCLAAMKPAGVLSAHFQGRDQSLDQQVKEYLRVKYAKQGNVYLGVVHRLDQPVSGVLLFARTSKAAARLSEQFREGTVEKTYWAVIHGAPASVEGRFEDWLLKDEVTRTVSVVSPNTPGARFARTDYHVLRSEAGLSWVELLPRTGRGHQLRVQLSSRGWPIFGDSKYGARSGLDNAIALHARRLVFRHPVRDESVTLNADPPVSWTRFRQILKQEQS